MTERYSLAGLSSSEPELCVASAGSQLPAKYAYLYISFPSMMAMGKQRKTNNCI